MGRSFIIVLAALFCIAVAELVVKEGDREYNIPKGWEITGRADPNAIIKLTFAVKQQNLEELERIFWEVSDPRSPQYGHFLSSDQISDLVGPSADTVEKIVKYLTAHGVTDMKFTRGNEFIEIRVPIKTAEKIINAEYFHFVHTTGRTTMRITGDYYLPKSIAEHIDFVGGVIRFPPTRSTLRTYSSPQQDTITPTVIKQLFDMPADIEGKSSENSQAVAQFLQEYYVPADLTYFQQQMNLTVQPVAVEIGPNDPTNPGDEAELDIQYIMGTAQNVPSWFVSTAGEHEGQEPFLDWIVLMINTTNAPLVHSVSYGDDENSLTNDWMTRINEEFQKYGSMGRSILFASGDDGVGCNDQCTYFVPNFPATSPYVTAVGGIFYDGSFEGDSISSGGFSNEFKAPSYQAQAVKAYLANQGSNLPPNSFYNISGRAFPDICSFSEDVVIAEGQQLTFVAGTSCAAPVVSGIISLLNDARLLAGKQSLGFLNPFLYQTFAATPNAFFDITTGNNGGQCCANGAGFNAAVGWDPITGLGAPNWPNLLAAALKV